MADLGTWIETARGSLESWGVPADPAIAVGAAVLVLLVAGLAVRRLRRWSRVRRDRVRSARSHERAADREPPVSIGDVRELGVAEFSHHHSGERHAVGKVEGFVLFVEDVPGDVDAGDVIRAKVLSFNRGGTSATATYLERVS